MRVGSTPYSQTSSFRLDKTREADIPECAMFAVSDSFNLDNDSSDELEVSSDEVYFSFTLSGQYINGNSESTDNPS